MKTKRVTMVSVNRLLTREERKNYKKENPDKRLCFRLRYPNFPLFLSLVSLIIAILGLLAWLLI